MSKSKIFGTRYYLIGSSLLLLAVAWIVFRTGVRPVLNLEAHLAVADSWPQLPSGGSPLAYALSSPTGFAVYQAVGVLGKASFLWQQALTTIFALTIFTAVAIRELGSREGWQAARIILLGSLGAVLVHWIGIYDSYTFLAWALFLAAWSFSSTAGVFATASLLGFQHLNQALFGLGAFFVSLWIFSLWAPKTQKVMVLAFSGLLFGKLAQVTLYNFTETDVSSTAFGREAIAFSLYQTRSELSNGLRTLPILVWSLFAGLWLMVFFLLRQLKKKQRLIFVITLSTLFLVALIAGDKTRVFVMVAFPLMFVMTLYFFRNPITPEAKWYIEASVWVSIPLVVFAGSVLPIGWNGSLVEQLISFPVWFP